MQNNMLFTLHPLNINNFAQNNNILLASTYLPRILAMKNIFGILLQVINTIKIKIFQVKKQVLISL